MEQTVIEALTDKGKSTKRTANEDGFFVVTALLENEPVHIGVVCDGLGGMGHGAVASNFVITSISNYLVKMGSRVASYDILVKSLTKRIHEINYELYMLNKKKGTKMGTTIVMSIVSETCATLLHSGDSRAYLVSDGRVEKKTTDHSYVEYLYSQKKLKELPPENDPLRSKLVACMGLEDSLQYALTSVAVQKGDALVLASDGYWGYATTQDFISIADGSKSLCESFMDVLDRGSTDNITVVIVRL